MTVNPVFTHQKDGYVASDDGCSGWYPRALHGGAVAGLIMHLVEAIPTTVPMMASRLTLDLCKPVLQDPISPSIQVIREGKHLQLLSGTLAHKENTVARFQVLKLKQQESGPTVDPEEKMPPPTAIADTGRFPYWHNQIVFARQAVDVSIVEGDPLGTPGPGAVWVRMKGPLLEGQPNSPAMRAVIAADFGNAISNVVSVEEYVFINADLSVSLYRAPQSDWIGLRSTTYICSGKSCVSTRLYDLDGLIGFATQNCVVARRSDFYK